MGDGQHALSFADDRRLEMESSLQIQAIFAITSLQAISAIITLGIRREIIKHIEVDRQGVTLNEAIVTR